MTTSRFATDAKPWMLSRRGFERNTADRACSVSVIASFTADRVSTDRPGSTPKVLEQLRELIPLAPLHQPYNLAAIEAAFERMPDVPQVACFDTSFHRGQPAVAELVPLPLRSPPDRTSAIRLSRVVLRIHRFRPSRGRSGNCEWARHRCASGKRREHVCDEGREEHRQHAWVSQRWMGYAWEPGRARSIPASSCICSRA